jgi:hypothetical protein
MIPPLLANNPSTDDGKPDPRAEADEEANSEVTQTPANHP